MKKEFLIDKINLGMSLNQISNQTNKSLTSIRYWVKKHNITIPNKSFKDLGKKDYGDKRFCPRCEKECKIEDFYTRRGKENSSVYCKKCTNIQTLGRQRNFKKQMVDYKGGKCMKCGYDKCINALEFHHMNPQEKDFTLSHMKNYSFNKIVTDELDKCILVCANCHREIHFELTNNSYPRLDSNQKPTT